VLGTSIAVQGRVWVFECPSPKVGTESGFPGKGVPPGHDGARYTKLGDPK
jgi:hypothetical protein